MIVCVYYVFDCLFVQVNEEGSEAAAATAGIMISQAIPPKIKWDKNVFEKWNK
jgi:serine protease inhibitor